MHMQGVALRPLLHLSHPYMRIIMRPYVAWEIPPEIESIPLHQFQHCGNAGPLMSPLLLCRVLQQFPTLSPIACIRDQWLKTIRHYHFQHFYRVVEKVKSLKFPEGACAKASYLDAVACPEGPSVE